MEDNVFKTLSAVDCSAHVEQKNGLSYLSWAWAWAEVKKRYPDAVYTIYESRDGLFYHTDGRTCWVKTGVTIRGLEHIEYLPVMDYKNKSIPLDSVTSFDVNKAIQRSLTKACARHGLGLYIYAGEDLPESAQEAAGRAESGKAEKSTGKRGKAAEEKPAKPQPILCDRCGKEIAPAMLQNGMTMDVAGVVSRSRKFFGGATYCSACQTELALKRRENGAAG